MSQSAKITQSAATTPTSNVTGSQKVNNFIAKHNIITATICIIIGSCINELVNEFFDGVVLCVIDEKKTPDKKFEDLEVTVFKKKIRVGKLIILILKLFIIIFVVIILEKLLERTL
jgi:large-conductance mechanosensitive channel